MTVKYFIKKNKLLSALFVLLFFIVTIPVWFWHSLDGDPFEVWVSEGWFSSLMYCVGALENLALIIVALLIFGYWGLWKPGSKLVKKVIDRIGDTEREYHEEQVRKLSKDD